MKTYEKRCLFNNKWLKILIPIILISICASPPIALRQVYIGEDMLYHILRIEELSKNILNGHIFPYIHSTALNGYGYASAFFYPELMLLLPALLCIAGLKAITAINISIVFYNILAGIITYVCLKIYLNDIKLNNINVKYASLLGALLYIVYPYRLYNIFYRAALNEFIAMCFIPIALLAMYKIFIKKEYRYWKLLSLGFTLTLLTHLGSTLLLGIVGVILFISNIKCIRDRKFILSMLKAIICSILASAYFLIPMIEQMLSNEFFYTTLPMLNNIEIYPNQTIDKKAMVLVGNSINQAWLLVLNIIIVYLFVVLYRVLSSKLSEKRYLYVAKFVFIFIYVFIMQTDIFPWRLTTDIIPFIEKIQFPFRIFSLLGLLFALIITFTAPKIESFIFKVVVVLFIGISPQLILTDQYMETLSVDESRLDEVDITWCLAFGEYLPSKISPKYEEQLKDRGNSVVLINKDGSKKSISRDVYENYYRFNIDNRDNNIESVELPIIYYKGYSIENNKYELELNESSNGLLCIRNIPNAVIDFNVKYKGTVIQKLSQLITVFSLIGYLGYYLVSRKENSDEKK